MNYRVFRLNDQGRVDGVTELPDCRNDLDAMKEAHRLLTVHDLEVWDAARAVCVLRPACAQH